MSRTLRPPFREPNMRLCELRFRSSAFPDPSSLSRGCRFSLFSAKPCTPMLNFFARSGRKIEKIDSLCPGRGQARLARAGEGSSHAVAYLHSLCTSQTRSLLILNRYSVRCAHVADSLARSAFGSASVPLPAQRLSIFSVFRKAMHANAQLFCSLGPQDREHRQPLSRERASAPGARG